MLVLIMNSGLFVDGIHTDYSEIAREYRAKDNDLTTLRL